MFTRFRLRTLLPLAAIGIAALLSGCINDPYGYYGYGYPYGYTAPASVNFVFWDNHYWRRHWDH